MAIKPRLNISLPVEVVDALTRLSVVTGIARTSWAQQFLVEALPVIEAMADAFEMARQDKSAAADRMRQVGDKMMMHAAQARLQLDDRLNSKARKRGTGIRGKKQ